MIKKIKKIFLTIAIFFVIFFPKIASTQQYGYCCICEKTTNIDNIAQTSITPYPDIVKATECEDKSSYIFQTRCKIEQRAECGPPREPVVETTKLGEEFGGFKDVVLGVTIPSLQFSAPPSEVDTEGNIYISWIGEYLKALYNFAVVMISIIAIVVIIMMGIKIITSGGGPAKADAYKRITQAVIGLFIAWGSYAILFAINPNLTVFKSLQIKFIENQPLEEFIGTVDDDVDLSEMANMVLPEATGDTPYAKLKSVCTKNPLTLESLRSILVVWVDIGSRGGSLYVRGGHTSANGCKATGAQVNWMINHFLEVGITFPNPNNYTKESLKKLSDDAKKALNRDKVYQNQLLEIYNTKELANYKGRMCGDCGTWIYQLYKCAGLPGKQVAIPQLKKTKKEPYYLIGDDKMSCREAIQKVEGGIKFGDIIFSVGYGHWFMYTGGTGLQYQIVEMGGQSSRSCAQFGAIPGINNVPKTCVIATKNVGDYFIIVDKQKKDKGCYIYRILGK